MKRKSTPWLIGAGVVAMLALGVGLSWVADLGVANRTDGAPAIARVQQTTDGSCIVGLKRHHCYRLTLEVWPENEATFLTHLDVNVPDRFASRVQPGSAVWVVRDRESPRDVRLAIDAFADPPPALPTLTR